MIFGVAGVGKTTIGKLLASELGWEFYDADDFHPLANIEKMKRGEPLTDRDRKPWLDRLRQRIEQSLASHEKSIVACSALKKSYRDQLRVNSRVKFVFLHGERDRIAKQLKDRPGHFFNVSLLDTQFADLEEPESSEDAFRVELRDKPDDLVREIKEKMGCQKINKPARRKTCRAGLTVDIER